MLKCFIAIHFGLHKFLDDFLDGDDFLDDFFNMYGFLNVDGLDFDLVFGFFLVSYLNLQLIEFII